MSEDQIPINATDLAASIRRCRSYVSAMKAAGYRFTHGNRTLLRDALKWLRLNPEFRSTSYHAAASKDHKRQPRLPVAIAGTIDEPAHSND